MAVDHSSVTDSTFLFGRLAWDKLPITEPIVVGTFIVVALGGAALVAALTYFRLCG